MLLLCGSCSKRATKLTKLHGERARHTLIEKLIRFKKDKIPGLDTNIEKATEALSELLEENIAKKVKEARKDLESLIISSINKRILETTSRLRRPKGMFGCPLQPSVNLTIGNCFDLLDNCGDLKASNVCVTSLVAMQKSCNKTCGLCPDNKEKLIQEPPKLSLTTLIHDHMVHKASKLPHTKPSHKQKKKPKILVSKHLKKAINKIKNKLKKTHPIEHTKNKKRHSSSLKQSCPEVCKTDCLAACPKHCCTPHQKDRVLVQNSAAKPSICPTSCKK